MMGGHKGDKAKKEWRAKQKCPDMNWVTWLPLCPLYQALLCGRTQAETALTQHNKATRLNTTQAENKRLCFYSWRI